MIPPIRFQVKNAELKLIQLDIDTKRQTIPDSSPLGTKVLWFVVFIDRVCADLKPLLRDSDRVHCPIKF